MAPREYLGEFEQMVLLAIVRLHDNAYGVSIHDEIVNETGRGARRGAVYVALERLERKGLVGSGFGDAVASRGGRPRRFYTLTHDGKQALRASREALMTLWAGIESELEEA